MNVSRTTGVMVAGSPLNALQVVPPFREYHLIDLDGAKATSLRGLVADRSDVHVYEDDCNDILLRQVFPRIQYTDFRRGLVLVDPYGLHLDWEVLRTAGQVKTIGSSWK